MSVSKAVVRTPMRWPVSTIAWANCRASSCFRMNAPVPHFTSSTRACKFSASFLLMMLAQMSGMLGTVPETSRKAYSLRSAGTRSAVAPVMTQPTRSTTVRISSVDKFVRKPGIDSNLSSVPPVAPSPRPEIIGTFSPQQANSGAMTSEVLSPMPPVECLSTSVPKSLGHCSVAPLRSITSTKAAVSAASMPRKKIAIARADI